MKGFAKSIFAFAASIFIVGNYIGGLSYSGSIQTLILASLALSLGHMIIVPLINLLLLPINILTLGSFKWVSVVLLLIIVTFVIPGFAIHPFNFPALSTPFISTPSFSVSAFFAFFLVSFLISIVSNFFFWILN